MMALSCRLVRWTAVQTLPVAASIPGIPAAVAPTVQRRNLSYNVARHVNELEMVGYTVVQDLFTPAEVKEMQADYKEVKVRSRPHCIWPASVCISFSPSGLSGLRGCAGRSTRMVVAASSGICTCMIHPRQAAHFDPRLSHCAPTLLHRAGPCCGHHGINTGTHACVDGER